MLVTLLALAAVLAGCGGGGEETGGKKTELNVRMVTDIQTLDPHSSSGAEYNILQQIYDSLVEFEGGNQFAVRACLAHDWEINDAQTEFVFYLRDDVKFHDGTPLTAEDVVFTVERFLVLPATASKSYFVDKAEAIDEHTVKITLKYPYPNFILQLASWPWRIVSKAA
ncbi:MAG: ABC transporter substrate-binding protein, partial [Firmicutes bacterium]|nr:ABC transporter substrate-binding protein [Bacillota bacterium]